MPLHHFCHFLTDLLYYKVVQLNIQILQDSAATHLTRCGNFIHISFAVHLQTTVKQLLTGTTFAKVYVLWSQKGCMH